ncbi:NAD-dependent epimerase/dehydratase family protein [Ferruginibacter paludis]|uniref:NAD-dependent epimerase/dehydratase family protein n=1 Tax=Ferruginibacter paludis TaxID=1310417 RepID=UPI0025B4F58E|nr:NAD-dependent epimerase/dehydratase family protein [Ferruginibacter paludis]MDN3658653.1 NAD-dependent epimerase/dehydratase family protein [Ferruginibacter paludis]
MKLFVTGGGGFLGSAIVRQLRTHGHEVVTFSRGNYPELDLIGVTHFQGNLSEYTVLKAAMTGCEAVFHVAAKTGIWGKYEDFYRANVTGTENVLQACRELGIRNLVFTSSPSVVYRGKDSEGHNESLPYPSKYSAYYPKTKASAEKLVMAANDTFLKTVSLRPHLIWGPGDYHFIPRLFKKARAGKLRIPGTSLNRVDCIYIDNAAKAHLQAFAQLLVNPATVEGKTYFISQGAPIPIAELINQLLASGGLPPVAKTLPPAIARFAGLLLETIYQICGFSGEPAITLFLAQQLSTAHWYDISAARRDFGYGAEVSLEEGMERLRAWLLRHSASVDNPE